MKYDIEKMAVDVEELDRAIGGDHDGLETAFLWEATPQGYGYWIDQARCEYDYTLVSLADDAQTDAPKKWRDMTDAEKGALLLAAYDGKAIEFRNDYDTPEWKKAAPMWASQCYYRVKQEPVRETVSGWWNGKNFHNTENYADRTHRITFDTIDGEPDCSTIKMEPITKEESK